MSETKRDLHLLHGTDTKSAEGIERDGLVRAQTGPYLSFYARRFYYPTTPMVFAAEPSNISPVVNTMAWRIKRLIANRGWIKVGLFAKGWMTDDDIREYGAIVLLERRHFRKGPQTSVDDRHHPQVEMGDFYAERDVPFARILRGDEMLDFLRPIHQAHPRVSSPEWRPFEKPPREWWATNRSKPSKEAQEAMRRLTELRASYTRSHACRNVNTQQSRSAQTSIPS